MYIENTTKILARRHTDHVHIQMHWQVAAFYRICIFFELFMGDIDLEFVSTRHQN